MSERFPRHIELDGAVNFRDIGGYPAANGRRVRWRRIFRSDNLGNLTAADHERLAKLGLRALVDFRVPDERRRLPNRLAESTTIQTFTIGFMAEGVVDLLHAVSAGTPSNADIERVFLEQYRRFVTDHGPQFAQALAYALDAQHQPLVMHCTSGKDRTGFAICALLLALGTPRATILEDYALTNSHMRDISSLFKASAPPDLVRLVMTAQTKYLEAAFDEMQKTYGSVDAYLSRALALDDDKRARLADLLTEPA
jgi:protein-tyrosine phosphatase